jgi:hypothetical protein
MKELNLGHENKITSFIVASKILSSISNNHPNAPLEAAENSWSS